LSPRDRPGQADVLFGYLVHRSGPSGPTEQGYLARVAVPDGRVLWNGPLHEPLPLRFDVVVDWRFRPGLADLDGDGTLDLVLWVPAPTEDLFSSHLDLCAFSGRDGSLLWKGLGFTGRPGRTPCLPFVNPPRPLVGDVDGDGAAEVVVTTFREQSFEVVVLNGKDGQPKWSWRGDDGWLAHSGSTWEHATPRWVHLAAGPALCVSIHDQKLVVGGPGKSSYQLVLLDAAGGQVLQRRDFGNAANAADRFPCWSLDLDGNGRDEVVFIDGGKVHATHGGIERELWSWPLPGDLGSILEVRPGTVVVAAGSSVYGLDGATGVPRWRCEANNPTLLHPADPQALPRLITSNPNPVCRMALPALPTGQYTMPTPTPATYGPPAEDLRLARRLPWYQGLSLVMVAWGPTQLNLLVSCGFAVALILAGLSLRRAIRRRSWKFGLLALVLLAVAAGWAWFHFGADVKEWALPYLAWVVVVLVPLLLFVLWPIRSLFRGRWRGVLLWLLLLVLSTAAIAAVAWAIDVRKKDPSEYYVWDDWYVAFLPGAWLAALLIVAAFLLRALFRAGRRFVAWV
jgi:outer membrane protein assembly factor BamB